MQAAPEGAPVRGPQHVVRVAARWLEDHRAILALVAAGFVARWFLAPWNSYWLDELDSVTLFGIWQDSIRDVARALRDTSIHPPLYQSVLWAWMQVFGDSELATRSLSNLYVALATLFVHLTVCTGWGERTALMTAFLFTFAGMPVRYALETRSYAQTLFLVALSTYALLVALRPHREAGLPSTSITALLPVIIVAGANTALLLTHYYNLFWFVVQGLVAVALLTLARGTPLRRRAGALVTMYVLPVVLFALVWGRILIGQVQSRAEAFALEDDRPSRGLIDLARVMFDENLASPVGMWRTLLVLVVVGGIPILLDRFSGTARIPGQQAVTWLVSLALFVGPLVATNLGFLLVGAERYSPRYFIFVTPSLIVLLSTSVHLMAGTIASRLHRGLDRAVADLVIAALILSSALPAGLNAATHRKDDWRGIIASAVTHIERDPERIVVLDTSFRATPVSTYYFARYSDDIRPVAVQRRRNEDRNSRREVDARIFPAIDALQDLEHDAVLVLFTHHRTRNFPIALEELRGRYTAEEQRLSPDGRGYIIFRGPVPRTETAG